MSSPVPNTPGAALAALRASERHVCPVCHREFDAITIARYCSPQCRGQAKRARRKARATPVPEPLW